jgi:hypothetical protein
MTFGTAVLAAPDLFPARRAGETWGAAGLLVELGGEVLSVCGLSPQQEVSLRGRYGPLCRSRRAGAPVDGGVRIDVFRADRRDFLPPAGAAEELPLELEHEPNEVRLASRDFMARLELGAAIQAMSGALWTPQNGDRAFLGAFENFARVVVAYRLLARGGLLLHSAAVVDGGRAHLFAGRSGAGKTTVARLSRESGREVLSDDINVLVPGAGGTVFAERLPFAGELGASPRRGPHPPVAGVHLLRQGDRHELAPLPRPRALAQLLVCAPFVNADPHRLDAALEVLAELVATVPVGVLTFRRDPGFWAELAGGDRS